MNAEGKRIEGYNIRVMSSTVKYRGLKRGDRPPARLRKVKKIITSIGRSWTYPTVWL